MRLRTLIAGACLVLFAFTMPPSSNVPTTNYWQGFFSGISIAYLFYFIRLTKIYFTDEDKIND